jgi:hypothetical protein
MSFRTGIFVLATMFFGCYGSSTESHPAQTTTTIEENQFSEVIENQDTNNGFQTLELKINNSWIVENDEYDNIGIIKYDVVSKINNIDLKDITTKELIELVKNETSFKIEIIRDSKVISLDEIINLEINLSEDDDVIFTPYAFCVPKTCSGGRPACDKCVPISQGIQCCDVCADGGCQIGTCGISPNTYTCCLNTSLCDF